MSDSMHNHLTDRRQFLSTVGAASATVATRSLAAAPAQQNDFVRLGFIGLGGRGNSLLTGFMQRRDCRVVALCDVNVVRLAAAGRFVEQQTRRPVATQPDYRELLQQSDVDAVVIATPDHWHSPLAVFACRAGKHVYVEKPVSNNVWESRKLVEAARKYDRVVQVGTQNRSADYNMKARDYIRDGKLGKIVLVQVYNQKSHGTFTMQPDADPPMTLQWDIWNGPCPRTQFNPTRFQHWHEFWDYGGGDVTNCGVHQMDLACMVLDIETLPNRVYSVGTRRPDTAAETPDTLVTTFEYDDYPMTFQQTLETPYMLKTDPETRNSDMFPLWPQNATRIEIFGSKGVMFLGRHGGGWQVFARPKSRKPVVKEQMYGRFPDPEHKQDFVDAIRQGRRPNADVEHGHRSAALCHLANIGFRVGNELLVLDRQRERITNSDAANALLRPEMREEYEIPDAV